jgi:hypothetical protein
VRVIAIESSKNKPSHAASSKSHVFENGPSQLALEHFIKRRSIDDSCADDSDFYPFKKEKIKRLIQINAVTNASRPKRDNQVAREMVVINKKLIKKKPEDLLGVKGV